MTDDELRARIVVNPNIMVGQPCVAGTSLTVRFILNVLAHGTRGTTVEEILAEYPRQTRDDVQAYLLYASDLPERESSAMLAATG